MAEVAKQPLDAGASDQLVASTFASAMDVIIKRSSAPGLETLKSVLDSLALQVTVRRACAAGGLELMPILVPVACKTKMTRKRRAITPSDDPDADRSSNKIPIRREDLMRSAPLELRNKDVASTKPMGLFSTLFAHKRRLIAFVLAADTTEDSHDAVPAAPSAALRGVDGKLVEARVEAAVRAERKRRSKAASPVPMGRLRAAPRAAVHALF